MDMRAAPLLAWGMRMRAGRNAVCCAAGAMALLGPGGGVFAFDFIAPDCRIEPDAEEIAARLAAAYPDFVARLEGGAISIAGGAVFDVSRRGRHADFPSLLNFPTLADQFAMPYPERSLWTREPGRNCDPGRVRHEPFFQAMYGASERDVEARLTEIDWGGRTLRVTTVNGVDEKLAAIADELEELSRRRPELRPIWENTAGVYNWRKIAGTQRLSAHSFGAAIDLSPEHSEYWLNYIAEEGATPAYRNSMPLEIVEIFADYGFIWGGAWSHFDTMHFEYRPELLQ